jgi:hypothetical protein
MRAVVAMLVVCAAGCQCARLDPALQFRCDPRTGADCPDAGTEDAGAEDAGTDGGCPKGDEAGLCADGVDNDCNGLTDCADPACIGEVCRSSSGSCDPAEKCSASTGCPADVKQTAGELCDDGNVCTLGDRCQADAGCAGARDSGVWSQCRGQSGIMILNETAACGPHLCGSDAGAQLFRGVPVASLGGFLRVFSPKIDPAGPCVVSNLNVCGDWYLVVDTDAGSYCATNTFTAGMWPPNFSPPGGTVPFYEYRNTDTGLHSFGASPTPPDDHVLDPPGAAFYACPL